eukprot:3922020-Pyramimonas_sp.AAC.2
MTLALMEASQLTEPLAILSANGFNFPRVAAKAARIILSWRKPLTDVLTRLEGALEIGFT